MRCEVSDAQTRQYVYRLSLLFAFIASIRRTPSRLSILKVYDFGVAGVMVYLEQVVDPLMSSPDLSQQSS